MDDAASGLERRVDPIYHHVRGKDAQAIISSSRLHKIQDTLRVFESALGYNQSNADQLIGKIQQGALTNPAVMGKADQFGQRFTVNMPITGPNGNTVVVRTGWVLDPGATVPRLATAYVK